MSEQKNPTPLHQKLACVLELLQGTTTLQDLAQREALTPTQLQEWLETARQGMQNALRGLPEAAGGPTHGDLRDLIPRPFAGQDMIVVSPDLGGVSRARKTAERLSCGMAIIDKRRPEPGVAEVMNIIGSVEGKTAILVDDMVDTAGSLTEAARALKKYGAKEVYACCTHPVLTDPALSRISQSEIKELVVTNTIPLPPNKKHPKIKVLSIAPILAETVLRIFNDWSVSQLFEEVNKKK